MLKVGGKVLRNRSGGERSAQVVSLGQIAPENPQPRQLFDGLYAFGDHTHSQKPREGNYSQSELACIRIPAEPCDERGIQLEVVRVEIFEREKEE